MNNWNKVKLSKLCYRIGDGLHGTPNYVEHGEVYFINGNNLKNGEILVDSDTKRVSETELNINYIELNDNSLLMSINGTLGNMAFYRNEKVMLGKSAAYLNFKYDINRFYYYYFQLPGIQKYFYDVATGSTIKNLSLKSLQDFEVPLPNEPTYKKIASVLSTLDYKIELNNKINTELEAMAKTLYDYWFVQFDFPDVNGKPYKSYGGKMVYDEKLKREIPEGWEVKNIEEIAKIVDCLHSKKPDYSENDNNKYLLQLENILDNGLVDISYKYFVSDHDYKNWTSRIEINEHDVLITNAGRVAATAQASQEIKSGIGRNITAIRPLSINPTYFFLSFRGYDIQKQIKSNTDQGAFFTSFNVKGIKKLNFIIPPSEIEIEFEKIAFNFRRKRELNLKENQELASLRDWLLPMLMNGQVTVGEAEYKVEEKLLQVPEPE